MNAARVICFWMGMVLMILCGPLTSSAFAQFARPSGDAVESLPPDVDPNSLSRMPRAKREQFTKEDELKSFDRITALEDRFGAQTGAIGGTLTRIQLPTVAELFRTLLTELRSKSDLEPKYQELAILASSREFNNATEWVPHEKNLVKFYSQDLVEVLRNNKDVKGLGEKEATMIQFIREAAREPKVSAKTFAGMERLFGRKSTLAVSLIEGYYAASAILFRSYDQHLNVGVKAPFPGH